MIGRGIILFLIPLTVIPLTARAADLPPMPPGWKPALPSPRAATVQINAVMNPQPAAPWATNAPATLVVKGWTEFNGDVIPRLALRFTTNAPHATIFTRTFGTNWNCWSRLDDIRAGSIRELSWCPTPGSAGILPAAPQLFRVILHD